MDERFRWAFESLSQLHKEGVCGTVFDVGAGAERMRRMVQSLGLKYASFDSSPSTDNVIGWNVEFSCPSRTLADVVILLEVIEHLSNPGLGLRNIVAAIKRGGYLILSVPNPAWSDSRFSLLRKGVLTMFTQEDLEVNHHVFTPWQHVVFRMLSDSGLAIVASSPIGGRTTLWSSPFWGRKMPLRIAYRAMKIALERADASSIGPLYGVVAKKL
jgi:SAM-dependent methyltransferase